MPESRRPVLSAHAGRLRSGLHRVRWQRQGLTLRGLGYRHVQALWVEMVGRERRSPEAVGVTGTSLKRRVALAPWRVARQSSACESGKEGPWGRGERGPRPMKMTSPLPGPRAFGRACCSPSRCGGASSGLAVSLQESGRPALALHGPLSAPRCDRAVIHGTSCEQSLLPDLEVTLTCDGDNQCPP